jgi:hypothetical protein
MARDGVFFKAVANWIQRSRVPVVAIVLAGVWAAVIALTGKYDQILNYVVSIDVLAGRPASLPRILAQSRAKTAAPSPDGARARSPGDGDGLVLPSLGDFGVDDRAVSPERRNRSGHSIGWCRRLLVWWRASPHKWSSEESLFRGGRNGRVYRR